MKTHVRSATLCLGLLFLFSISAPCMAAYSGLVLIPTADVLGQGEYCIEPQVDDTLEGDESATRMLNLQLGLTPRFEMGIDLDVSDEADTRSYLNAKYLAVAGGENKPAIAVGICNMGNNSCSSPYIVGTHEFTSARAHLGVMRIDHKNRLFIGADRPISDKLTLMADYTAGDENYSSVGFDYAVTEKFSIFGGILIPNDSDSDTGFSLHLVFSGP
ncbi:MAG: hypothetical protein ACPL7O_09340 [Armatimonadota bacterium]